jgi:flagellar hook-associated protein 2
MSSGIGAITFQGLSSGLDTQEIIDKLLELERRPISLIEDKKTRAEEKRTILEDLNTKTRTLRDILRKIDNMNTLGSGLSSSEEFRRFEASSSDETIATATAGGRAMGGSIVIGVEQLAQQERNSSNGFSEENSSVGTGTLQFRVGSGDPVSITIDSSNEGLTDLAAAVNDANAGVGAFVIYDGGASASPYRLVISSTETGADHAITFDSVPTGLTLTESQAAQNARIIIDRGQPGAITIESATNTFDSIAQDLSITVKRVDPTNDVTISLDQSTDKIVENLKGVVDAYNEIISIIDEQAVINPATNRGGPLIGDRTLLDLKQALATAISTTTGSGSVTSAFQVGLTIDRDGLLTLDEDKLRSALDASFDDVSEFFATRGGGFVSFSDRLRKVTDRFVDAVDGALVARIEGANRTISDLAKDIEDAEDRLERSEQSLVLKFSQLERLISQMKQQSDYLAQYLLS